MSRISQPPGSSGGGGGSVNSVSAGDSTITIGGTASDPTVAVTGLTTLLAAKAPLASPTLTGTPAAPTATAGTNTTQLATTAFVTAAVSTQHTADNSAYAPASGIAPSAITGTAVITSDSRLSDARTPSTHASSHKSGGSDSIKLNELAAPTAAVALNSQKITGVANGTASDDVAAFGQLSTKTGFAYGVHPNAASSITGTPSANSVYLMKNTGDDCTISTIRIGNGATVAGNVIVGVYANGSTGGASHPTGTPTASSVSTAVAGTSAKQEVALQSSVAIKRGDWLAVIYSDATTTIARGGNSPGLSDGMAWRVAAGSFALPDLTSATFLTVSPSPIVLGF